VKATIWGCRGSLATPGRETVRYGGNTSCIEVRLDDGTVLILDAGTGIRSLGLELARAEPKIVHVLLTHLHLDHLEGLPFFAPLRSPETEVYVWGPPSAARSLRDRIARYVSPPLFPLQMSDFATGITFCDVPDGEWQLGRARVVAEHVVHMGPTIGYRIRENGASLTYIPDHEPALGGSLDARTPDWISGFALARGTDVLVHDAQYTEEEYAARVAWGHSSIADALAFARIAEAGRLILFHHDPMHDDERLEAMLADAVSRGNDGTERPVLAYEGMEILP
jgi:phosphoribosyl 1,2-cyclic phosphodiesterase